MLPKKLSRYTSIYYAEKILQDNEIILTDPKNWSDKNDKRLLEIYLKETKAKDIRVLCLTTGDESIHHWNNIINLSQ